MKTSVPTGAQRSRLQAADFDGVAFDEEEEEEDDDDEAYKSQTATTSAARLTRRDHVGHASEGPTGHKPPGVTFVFEKDALQAADDVARGVMPGGDAGKPNREAATFQHHPALPEMLRLRFCMRRYRRSLYRWSTIRKELQQALSALNALNWRLCP